MGAPKPNQTVLEEIRDTGVNLRTILDRMPVLAWSGFRNGSLDFVNRRWSEYTGLSLIVNVGINAEHGEGLISEEAADLVAFGRDYIANPDLVERIAASALLNPGRPEYYYSASAVGYTDYPFLHQQTKDDASAESQVQCCVSSARVADSFRL